jgi:hypothetical protein
MQVVVMNDSQESCDAAGKLDLREDPGAIERIEIARRHPALRGFLLSLNAEESPFSTFGCKVWNDDQDSGAERCIFASRVDLLLSHAPAGMGREQYEEFARRLATLLEREPGDSIRAELHIARAEISRGRQGFCLRLFLFARGARPEQAQLRWSLGTVRAQQALLFVARALRHQSGAGVMN